MQKTRASWMRGLRRRLEHLLEEHRALARRNVLDLMHGPSPPGDMFDDVQESIDDEIAALLAEINGQNLHAAVEALKRLKARKYGKCRTCGYDIPLKRLKANMFALRCVPCQSEFETVRPPWGAQL